jgi:tetratricopeptide (TPR) repeat protein
MDYQNLFVQTLEHLKKNPPPRMPFEGVKAATPIDALANTITGDTALEKKDYQEAINYFTRSIKIDAYNSYVFEKRALAYFLLADYQNALIDSNSSISIFGTFHNNKIAGESLMQMNEYAKAILHFDKAVSIFKEFKSLDQVNLYDYDHLLAIVCNNRGICFYKLGDLRNGISSAQEGIEFKINYSNNHFIKGIMLLQLGHKTEALKCLKNADKFGDPNARSVIQQYLT